MTRIRLTLLAAVPLSVVVFGLTGCGGGGNDPGVATAQTSGTGSKPLGADAVEQAQKYANCLKDAGVKMAAGADGTLTVDKDNTPAHTILDATERCRSTPIPTRGPASRSSATIWRGSSRPTPSSRRRSRRAATSCPRPPRPRW